VSLLLPAALAALAALAPERALAAGSGEASACAPACSELPAMQRELLAQEFLQERFQKYLGYAIVPTPEMSADPEHPGKQVLESMIQATQRDAAAALTRHQQSAAGGGQSGTAAPAAGTTSACEIVLILPGGKQVPYDDGRYRRTHACWDAEFLLAHERQHVADCKAGKKILEDYHAFNESDVAAYGAGIRRLRELMAETAKRCHWQGSVNKTKPNPVDKADEPVVPTAADVAEILDALKKAPTPAGRRK
jgi:hypothetical protein